MARKGDTAITIRRVEKDKEGKKGYGGNEGRREGHNEERK